MGFLAEKYYFTTGPGVAQVRVRSLDVNLGWRTGEPWSFAKKHCGRRNLAEKRILGIQRASISGQRQQTVRTWGTIRHQPWIVYLELHDGEACDGVTAFAAATTLR
jgi:hypothetical protein